MARSLTVPLTARWPIDPPGKNSGRTTNVSVENASRAPPSSNTAESLCPAPGCVAEGRHEQVLDQLGRHLTAAAVAHHHVRAVPQRQRAGPAVEVEGGPGASVRSSGERGVRHRRGSWSIDRQREPPVEVVRGAGALAGHHGGAERVARRALLAERRALVRLDQPLQHLAAAAHARFLGVDAGHLEAVLGVELAVLLRQPPAAVRDHPDAPPAAVGDLEDVLQQRPGGRVALRPARPGRTRSRRRARRVPAGARSAGSPPGCPAARIR